MTRSNVFVPKNCSLHFALCSLLFALCLASCHAQQRRADPSANFYEGLKKKQAEAKTEAVSCFEKALDSPNMHIAAASAAELMSLHYSGVQVRAETISRIRNNAPAMIASKASGSWAMALDALGADREKILALILNSANRSPDEAIQYLLAELRIANALGGLANANAAGADAPAGDGMFSNAENAAIAGRIAVSHSRYREALIFFRMVIADAPGLFFQYPELLGDLGRTFQYASADREGIDLFLQWEKEAGKDLNAAVRFRLLFFAARIARQRGLPEAVELFERALDSALALPDEIVGEQTDACIWYILNISLAKDVGRTIKYLEKYFFRWHDDGYYSDVMDKLARELLLKRRWADLINITALVANRPGVIGAKFAWITGRAIQSGLLLPKDVAYAFKMMPPLSPSGGPQDAAEAYIRIAYNNAPLGAPPGMPYFDGRILYYRSLSAAALGEPFLILPAPEEQRAKSNEGSESDAMQFLLGFFRNNGGGAAKFAPRYIRMMESDLPPEELRLLAEALGIDGQYQESMRLVSLYTRQDTYQYDIKDLELLYPRPFAQQVNQYARETGIEPAKLFALIRAESAFNPDAISRSGAIGLTQLMPATAEEMAARILRRGGPDYTRKPDKEGADEISGDADSNVHMGAAYLAYLETRLGDPLLAVLAYNGGMNRVRRWRNSMPVKFPPDLFLETVEYAETMEYGKAVLGAAAMYKALYPEP